MLQPKPEKRKQNCSSKVEENDVSPRYFCWQISFTNQSLSTLKLTYLVRCEIPLAPIKLSVLKKSWPTPHLQSRKHASMLVAWVLICNDPRINISQIWRWTGELKPSKIITQQHYVYIYIYMNIYIYMDVYIYIYIVSLIRRISTWKQPVISNLFFVGSASLQTTSQVKWWEEILEIEYNSTYRIHAWYNYLHLVDFYGKCR